MNSLTAYLHLRPLIRPGDVIAFQGTAPISHAIDLFSGSPLSHVGIVRQSLHSDTPDVLLSESTIEKGKSGPQTNPLGATLANYGDGARAWWLPLSDEVRKLIDWEGFFASIGAADGILKYDVKGLFGFLARSIPILGPRIFQTENQKQMVCSAYVVHVLEGAHVLRGINDSKTTPADVAEMAIYKECVQLIGTPGKIARFNTL